ncbi:MAG: AAA family ATPase [Eubacterium sp.]|nr:AAA family ATPase [Eubacterium sp.]
MNIQEAKQQIEQAVSVYLMKDGFGNYRIPLERQRPVFLIGAPGIGKTAIMEQIAKELDISLVSYSMTHHTRQSALGLPFIVHKNYQGESYNVSEYTMSEIIASVYENMEKSGKKEGILFLDEINCVSETLGPSMLQFLQYKTFGNHQIPKGWIVVTAGNPPEYNRSVHEFDVVTLDRLKVIEAEPDYLTWKNYAEKVGIHKSIQTYLDIKPDDFYEIETTVDGKNYVTARGWEDLSETIYLYEEKGYAVDETLISQYIRHPRISSEFSTYYKLYTKYRKDYKIHDILHGNAGQEIIERAKNASFDERITLMGLLTEALLPALRANVYEENALRFLLPRLKEIREDRKADRAPSVSELLTIRMQKDQMNMKELAAANGLTDAERHLRQYPIAFAEEVLKKFRLEKPAGSEKEFEILKGMFDARVKALQADTADLRDQIGNLFRFTETCYEDGNEMLILVTELTVNNSSAQFLARHGSDEYFRYSEKFMLSEREKKIEKSLNDAELSI